MELFAIDTETKDLDVEGKEILDSLRNLRQEIKALKALEEDAKRRFIKYLDDAMVAMVDGEIVARVRTVFTERPDWDALRSIPTYAEAIKAHIKSGEFTRIDIL